MKGSVEEAIQSRLFWVNVLWDATGKRVLPKTSAFDARLRASMNPRHDGTPNGCLFTVCDRFGAPEAVNEWPEVYFIPTVEWVEGVVQLARDLGAKTVMEVGAGDGFATRCLRATEPKIRWLATDDWSWKDRVGSVDKNLVACLDATEAITRYKPDLTFWCWPPMEAEIEKILDLPVTRYFLCVGEGPDGCTGWIDEQNCEPERLRHLDRVARCRTDHWWGGDSPYLHSCHQIAKGARA